MTKAAKWKKGRGKLGALAPLLGSWIASAESPMGKVRCTRTFTPVLGKHYVQLEARWEFGKQVYVEHAIIGSVDGALAIWSFTSDGKRSEGHSVAAPDVHPDAVAFESQMPAGIARQIYWPGKDGAVLWAVESKTKKGWNRFTLHTYRRA